MNSIIHTSSPAADSSLDAGYRGSLRHRAKFESTARCGCYHCLHFFSSKCIRHWIDEDRTGRGQTALCPRCGIDAVLLSQPEHPLTREFLRAMQLRWFGR